MTRADTAKLIAIIVMAYPNFDKFKDENQIKTTVELWSEIFKDDNGGIVGIAVKKHISTNKWPPSVAEIREAMLEMQAPDLIVPVDAWIAVSDLMSADGEYCHGDLDRCLPPLVARAVEALGGYSYLYKIHVSPYRSNGKPGMDRVAFMGVYEPLYEREKARAMTPGYLNTQIDDMAKKLSNGERLKLEEVHQHRVDKENQWQELENRQFERMKFALEERRALPEAGGEYED